MKIPLCIIGCMLYVAMHAQGYNSVDSLLRLLPAKQGRSKVDALTRLSRALRTKNTDSAWMFAEEALHLSRKENYRYGELNSITKMAAVYGVKAKLDSVILLCNQVLAESSPGDEALRAENYGYIGAATWQLGKPDEAILNYQRSADLWLKLKNYGEYGGALTGIGYVYQSQGKLDPAEQYIKQGLSVMKNAEDNEISLSNAYHALANIYGMKGQYAAALHMDSIGLQLVSQHNLEFSKSMFYDNMANCYMYQGNYEKATELYRKCIEIDSKFNNKKLISDTYLNMGNMLMQQSKHDAAIKLLDSAITFSTITDYKEGKQFSYQLLSDAYKAKGDDKKALYYLEKMMTVKDSILNQAREKRIVELQTLYETDKKEKELLLQKEQLSKQRYIMGGISVSFVLILSLMYMLYRRRQLRQEALLQSTIMQQQDMATKAILETEERERSRIAGDLHDGLGQMMSAVKMNLSSLSGKMELPSQQDQQLFDKTMALIDESCKEVRSVSHNMMPNALLKSGLASAVREFIDKIDHSQLQVSLHTEGLDERLDMNKETVLYRAIQESVNNVIKHAGANHLYISIIKDTDGISCTIEDNGKGFNASDMQSFNGIGIKNILSRIIYLKGTVEWDSSPGKGTLVAMHIPS